MTKALLCGMLAALPALARGHAYVQSPFSRNWGCYTQVRKNAGAICGLIQYEPWSVEGPDGFPSAGAADGWLATAGTTGAGSRFTELNEAGANRWAKNAMASGPQTFTWGISTSHATKDVRYYITLEGWDPEAKLTRAALDLTPFCTVSYENNAQLSTNLVHACDVPPRTGYHVVLAHWDVGDTPNSFYNVIDCDFGGAPSPPAPVPTTAPTTAPSAAPSPPPSSPPPSGCLAQDSTCGCAWAGGGASCGTDDGSRCWCMCCCEAAGGCKYSGVPAPPSGGCALPAELAAAPADVDNRGFVGCHGKLKVGGASGVQLVDASGGAVQLMGMSSHGLHWFPDCATKDAISHLVEHWGINVFRAAMYVGEGGYAADPSVKGRVLDVVQWCKELGIYVVIDWHVLTPGNPNDDVYAGADGFWGEMAALFKGEDHVLYEIANEPNGAAWGEVVAYHNRVLDVIRAVDPETVVLCGTPTWSQDIHLVADAPVARPHNVMYVFHFYAGSHMGLLDRVDAVADRIPLFVSEWGASMASGGGASDYAGALLYLRLFEGAGTQGVKLSWAKWNYADKDEASAALMPGACGRGAWDDTSCSGTFIKRYIKANVQTCGRTRSPPAPTPAPVPTTPAPPVPTTPAPPAPTPTPVQACVGEWGACTEVSTCCGDFACVRQNPWYAQCLPPTPVSAATPSPSQITGPPAPLPTTPAPPVPTPTPVQACVGEWGTCTDVPTCCGDFTCVRQNPWYAQCQPPGSTAAPTPAPTPHPPAGHGCVERWGPCRGGATCCDGFSCVYVNEWYSQCRPPAVP